MTADHGTSTHADSAVDTRLGLVGWLKRHYRPLIVFASGCVLIALGNWIHEQLWHHLIRDVGIGFIVSAVVFALIERQAQERHERDTEEQLFERLFGQLVDPAIWQEVRDRIVTSGFICDSWQLDVEITKRQVTPDPAYSMPGAQVAEQFVSVGTQRYTIRNAGKTTLQLALRHELQFIVVGTTEHGRVPRFSHLRFDVFEGASHYKSEWNEQQLRGSGIWKGSELLEKPLQLAAGGRVEVIVRREEVVDVPGEFPWYVFWLTKSPKLNVKVPESGELECYVLLRHHQGVSWEAKQPGHWELPTAFLPGQGFALMTRHKANPPSPTA